MNELQEAGTAMTLIDRFFGPDGRGQLVFAVSQGRLIGGDEGLAASLVDHGTLLEVHASEEIIRQGGHDLCVYFLVAGAVDILVNGKMVAVRQAGEVVGEMAAIEPSQPRSATVRTREDCVVLKLDASTFLDAANAYPSMWRRIAASLSRRLAQRNALITEKRTQVRVFVMSSVESLPVTRLIVNHFKHDKFLTIVWDHGVFRASNYTLDDLKSELERADIAVAIAHADDRVISRGDEWPSVRDNVIFELGMAIGFLGRSRAFLMESREDQLKLPSDLAGLTTVNYRYVAGHDAAAAIAPACNELRELIMKEGIRD